MKWKRWIFGIALTLLLPATAFAGDINAEEQTVLAVACSTFEYKGVVYQATPEHMAQARAKLMQDDVDLTPEQAQEAIANIYANVQTGIDEGYIVPISGSENTEGSSEQESSSNEKDNAGGSETSADTGNKGTSVSAETTESNNSESAPEKEIKTPEEMYWEETELPKLMEQRQNLDLIAENRIDLKEASETEIIIKDTGHELSGIWSISIIFLIGTGICTMCIVKYQLLAHKNES